MCSAPCLPPPAARPAASRAHVHVKAHTAVNTPSRYVFVCVCMYACNAWQAWLEEAQTWLAIRMELEGEIQDVRQAMANSLQVGVGGWGGGEGAHRFG